MAIKIDDLPCSNHAYVIANIKIKSETIPVGFINWKNKLKDLALEEPYDSMLSALAGIEGYECFLEFLKRSHKLNQDWKSEILALFEVNKHEHPLIEITSHGKNEPEGIFKIAGIQGIIEAAYINYEFDTNPKRDKLINIFRNVFRNILTTSQSQNLVFSIPETNVDVNEKQLLADKQIIKQKMNGNEFTGSMNGYYWALVDQDKINSMSAFGGNIEINGEERTFDTLIILFPGGSSVAFGPVSEFTDRIKRTLKVKRKQHSEKYPNHIKLYYFLLGCSDARLKQFSKDIISRIGKPRDNEIIVLSTLVGSKETGYGQRKFIGKSDNLREIAIDLSNGFIA